MTGVDNTPATTEGARDAAPFATARFSTREDLSGRLVLVPFDDDDCRGAKVRSREASIERRPPGERARRRNGTSDPEEEGAVGGGEETECVGGSTAGGSETEAAEGASDCDGKSVGDEADASKPTGKKRKGKRKKKKKDHLVQQQEKQIQEMNRSDYVEAGDSSDNNDIADAEKDIATGADDIDDSEESRPMLSDNINTLQQPIPAGHVLVKITGNIACREHTVDQLDEMDFTDILSLLRDVAYPISLTFTAPENVNKHKDGNETTCSHPSLRATTSEDTNPALDYVLQEDLNTFSRHDKEHSNHSILASREDAAKYAAQAATELRGRLTRWGFQAATKAAEAASAVQEMREERQRKLMEEQSMRNDQLAEKDINADEPKAAANKESSEEKKCDVLPSASKEEMHHGHSQGTIASNSNSDAKKIEVTGICHLFLQTSSGFAQLDRSPTQQAASSSSFLFSPPKQSTPTILVTNMSVITVRLSEDKACPVGKNCYKFQWYRSKNEYNKDVDCSSTEWHPLTGACYAAYQPSVSDVGYLLSCVVELGEGVTQRCISPLPVRTDQFLFDSAKSTLLKGDSENTASFSSLKDSSGSVFRLRLYVETRSESDSISCSFIDIDKLIDGSFQPLHQESIQLRDVKTRADSSRPRVFELHFSSLPKSDLSALLGSCNNCFQLDAPNRNARELLLVALGLAGFTGSLSSLSTDTTLLPSSSDSNDSASEDRDQTQDMTAANTESPLPQPALQSASSKNLYAIQLEAQVQEMRSELKAKAALVARLQQKLAASSDDKKKTEKELSLARSKTEALSKCQEEVKERDRLINDQERTFKSLNNEKAVLAAAIEARDGKIDSQAHQIKELEHRLAAAERQAEEERKRGADEALAKLEADKAKKEAETAAVIAEMKREEGQFQEELKLAQSIIEDLNQKYSTTKDSASKSTIELEQTRSEIKMLKMERNSLRRKADGLAKEITKLTNRPVNEAEIRTLTQTINQLQLHNSQLQNEVTALRSEKRGIQEELQATRLAHHQSARYIAEQSRNDVKSPSKKKLFDDTRYEELETLISNMTEHLDAKEMQINTLKQINEALVEEIDEVRAGAKKQFYNL